MLPPQHRVDRPMIFVLKSDTAWKDDDLEESLGQINDAHAKWEQAHAKWSESKGSDEEEPVEPMRLDQHPWAAYCGGGTRWDIHAELTLGEGTARPIDWLDISQATRFKLRRLRRKEYQEVHAMVQLANAQGITRPLDAWTKALECALVGMEGPDAIELKFARAYRGRGPITSETLDELFEHLGADQFADLAQAAWIGSLPLTEAEKKRCGS